MPFLDLVTENLVRARKDRIESNVIWKCLFSFTFQKNKFICLLKFNVVKI